LKFAEIIELTEKASVFRNRAVWKQHI